MLKEILFTHNDLDGYGCGIVYHLAHNGMILGEDYNVIHCTNDDISDVVNKWVDKLDPFTTIISFADIACNSETFSILKSRGFILRIFDHHPTNFYAKEFCHLSLLQTASTDDENIHECGTSLIYKYYKSKGMLKDTNDVLLDSFVDTIRSYDTWDWKKENNMYAKYLNALLFMIGTDNFVKVYLNKLTNKNDHDLIDEYNMIFILNKIENEQKFIDEFTPDKLYTINVRGYQCGLIIGYVPANIGDLAYQFLLNHSEFDMICHLNMNTNGMIFSFRGIRDDINIGEEIALPIGGGGHPKAAGAPISADFKNMIVEMTEHYLNM